MPLNTKGRKIMRSMMEEYGPEKGKRVFYASEKKGSIKGVTRRKGHKKGSMPPKHKTMMDR